jgi:peptidyl-prolyl cis-trans isomerase C
MSGRDLAGNERYLPAMFVRMPILVLSVTLLALSACRGGAKQSAREEIARVNDERIFKDEVERELRRMNPDSATSLEDRRRMLSTMVERKLLLQEAARLKVFVPTSESERVFSRLKDDYNAEDFGTTLTEAGQTPTEMKQEMHERLIISKLLREQVFDRIYIKDQEIADYVAAHPDAALVQERVHCSQIVQRTEPELSKVRGQVVAGMPFEEAANRYSIAPEASKGGDLGWFERKVMPPAIEEGCFALKPNEISGVVTSEFGFHLFKLLARKGQENLPGDKVREKVEHLLRQQRAQKEELAFVEQLRKKAEVVMDEAVLTKMH